MRLDGALVDRYRRSGQRQSPDGDRVAERGERQHAGICGRGRHADQRHRRWRRPRRAQRSGDPQPRHDAAGRGVQPERDGGRPADAADRIAVDRRGAGHARPGQRHRQPARQSAGPVLDAAQRPRQRAAAEPGGVGRDHAGAGHQHAQRRLHRAAADGAGQHRRRGRDAERDAGHHRRAQQQDRHAEGGRPEHRRSREPARRGGGAICRSCSTSRRWNSRTATC